MIPARSMPLTSGINAEALNLQWLQPEHGEAGLLVDLWSPFDHSNDELIRKLTKTVVCQQSYDALARVSADFVSDIAHGSQCQDAEWTCARG